MHLIVHLLGNSCSHSQVPAKRKASVKLENIKKQLWCCINVLWIMKFLALISKISEIFTSQRCQLAEVGVTQMDRENRTLWYFRVWNFNFAHSKLVRPKGSNERNLSDFSILCQIKESQASEG